MNSIKLTIYLLIISFFVGKLSAVPFVTEGDSLVGEIEIWPGVGPGSDTLSIRESITLRSLIGTCSKDRAIGNISVPTITPIIPENPNGAAVIICPGGAYQYVVYDVEGMDIGNWLNTNGITAFVLKYRLPSNAHIAKENVPLQDAQRAMRYVRAHAKTWGLDTTKIGIMGASAGGHLASTLAHSYNKKVYEAVDSIDNICARPDFMLLLYPVISMENNITHATTRDILIGTSPSQELINQFSAEKNVTSTFPPTFMTRAADDTGVNAENCKRLYKALQDSGIVSELKIFEKGGHGVGICKAYGTDFENWPGACTTWLNKIGVTANTQTHKVRIATVGNSITYGALLTHPATECYPAQLNEMLSDVYGDTIEIRNFSVSGRTMMKSAENPIWIENQFSRAVEFVPDICLILLGTNDAKPYRWDAWGDEFFSDYMAMIDTFKYRNPNTRFIVGYPSPIWEGHPYGDTFSNSHNDSVLVNKVFPEIDKVVEKTGATLFDFHTPFVDSLHLFPDKLHPNVVGAKYMAEIVYKKIIETDIIHQVQPGLAYISSFKQSTSTVPVGSNVELKWITIFADSVFLDGVLVDASGSINVIADENKVYTLTAKGPNNSSFYQLQLNTYVPEKSGLIISASSTEYGKGNPVVLLAEYTDQFKKKMTEIKYNITWSISEGEGKLEDQTDSSIVFIPVALGKVVVEAKDEELSAIKVMRVNSIKTSIQGINNNKIKVFPNPVRNTLYFQLENQQHKKVKIKVFNLIGDQVLERELTNSGQETLNLDMNISNLDEGVFIYAIYINNAVKFGQFIKLNN